MEILSTGFFPILIAMALYGALHSLLASLGVKGSVENTFGKIFAQSWYRLVFNIIAVLTLLPVFWLTAFSPDRSLWILTGPWNPLFRAIQIAGVIGAVVAVLQTGSMSFLGVRPLFSGGQTAEEQDLVTGGVYRYIRHPIYFFSLLFLWFSPVFTMNSLAFCLGATIYFLVGIVFEERKLVADFGQSYVDYQKKTPVLIPGLK